MYNMSIKKGRVVEIIEKRERAAFCWVKIPSEERCKAVNYTELTGDIDIGDEVVLNTTAVDLGLGTGGYHFVVLNIENINRDDKNEIEKNNEIGKNNEKKNNIKRKNDIKNYNRKDIEYSGHIMKLRYTPYQLKTFCVEEAMSPYHDRINKFKTLSGLPVIIIPLHSLLAPVVISCKYKYPEKKIVYIMSEGGSLALEFSKIVGQLLADAYLDKTITFGNSFGGDFETVNIFTALAAAREIVNADLIIVGMGPGIVGTGTRYGFSGVENAFIEMAVHHLQGRSIVVPRISFAENRDRHYGLSHHCSTLLTELITRPVELAFPENEYIRRQLIDIDLFKRHKVDFYDINEVGDILKKSDFPFNSMGRGFGDDPLFFITGGLAVYKV